MYVYFESILLLFVKINITRHLSRFNRALRDYVNIFRNDVIFPDDVIITSFSSVPGVGKFVSGPF